MHGETVKLGKCLVLCSFLQVQEKSRFSRIYISTLPYVFTCDDLNAGTILIYFPEVKNTG